MSDNALAGKGGKTVTNSDTANEEAKNDADSIKGKKTGKEAYEAFKAEIDDIQQNVKDESVRKQYRDKLTSELGADVKRMLSSYLQDKETGGKMRDATTGEVTEKSVDKRIKAVYVYGTEANEVDKVLLPQVDINFDELKDRNPNDGSNSRFKNDRGITTRDLEAADKQEAADNELKDSVKLNKDGKFAETLLDPSQGRTFDELDQANQFFNGTDGHVSKGDVDKFIKNAENFQGADKEQRYPKDYLEKLSYISANWNTPQIEAMKQNGYLTRNSIAKGCGYESDANFLANRGKTTEVQDKLKENTTTPTDGKTSTNDQTVVYKDGTRTFHMDKDNLLTGITVKKPDNSVEEYTVDKERNVFNASDKTVPVATEAFFDSKSDAKTFTYKTKEGDVSMSKVDETKKSEINPAFLNSAKQNPKKEQGPWQVAEQMLGTTKGEENETDIDRVRQTQLLTKVLQGRLGNKPLKEHQFVTTSEDLGKLTNEITEYANAHPDWRASKSAAALIKKLNDAAAKKE